MTFDDWYQQRYPGDWAMARKALSPPAVERYEQASAAWEAAYHIGYEEAEDSYSHRY